MQSTVGAPFRELSTCISRLMPENRHESEPIYRESLRNGIETERNLPIPIPHSATSHFIYWLMLKVRAHFVFFCNEPIYFSQFETICFKLKKTNLHSVCVPLYPSKYRKEIGIVENLEIIVDLRINETLQIPICRVPFRGSRYIGRCR